MLNTCCLLAISSLPLIDINTILSENTKGKVSSLYHNFYSFQMKASMQKSFSLIFSFILNHILPIFDRRKKKRRCFNCKFCTNPIQKLLNDKNKIDSQQYCYYWRRGAQNAFIFERYKICSFCVICIGAH